MSDARPTSRLPLVAAILLVLATGPCALTALAVKLEGLSALGHHYEEAGAGALIATLSIGLSLLVAAVILGFRAFGRAAPWTIAIAVAPLPWALGTLGEHLGIRIAASAVPNADSGSRSVMMARGLSEASNSTEIGAWLTAAVFGTLAIGAAIVARGEPATERRPVLAAIALPVILGCLVPIALAAYDVGLLAVVGVALAGLASALATAIGGASLGRSESGRLGAATLAAIVCGLGAVSFAGVAEMKGAEGDALGGLSNADATVGSIFVARGVAIHEVVQWSTYALGLALVVALVAAGVIAVRRGAAGRGALVDAGLALGCLAIAGGLGIASHLSRVALVEELGGARLPDLALAPMPPEARLTVAWVDAIVVGPEGLARIGGTPTPWSAGRAALAERFRDRYGVQLLLDARANGDHLSAALAVIQESDASDASLLGAADRGIDASSAPAVLALHLAAPVYVPVELCDPDEPPSADVAHIGPDGALRVTNRASGETVPFDPRGYDRVEVSFDRTASAASIAHGLARGVGTYSSQLVFCERPSS